MKSSQETTSSLKPDYNDKCVHVTVEYMYIYRYDNAPQNTENLVFACKYNIKMVHNSFQVVKSFDILVIPWFFPDIPQFFSNSMIFPWYFQIFQNPLSFHFSVIDKIFPWWALGQQLIISVSASSEDHDIFY